VGFNNLKEVGDWRNAYFWARLVLGRTCIDRTREALDLSFARFLS